ncbi:MAG: YoaK family protein [Pseudobdellovibrio sp.]
MFATNKINSITDDQANYLIDNFSNRKLWAIMAFEAGCINGGGFLACHRFVTHTTGFATQFGYDLAAMKWTDALAMITVPVFFMTGAMVGAYFVDRPLHRQQPARFHILFFLMAFFLTSVTLLGSSGVFGAFGQDLDVVKMYSLIALLCLSSGMLNACSTTASKSYVRTTHLTGYTTDLGISFMRLFSLKDEDKIKTEKNANSIRLLVIISFITGTAVSCFLFLKVGYLGFMIPALISLTLFTISKKEYDRHA